ncbi:hypothetical protein [Sphingomonas sp. Leaf412]|uniref:hypothetical protein n=1 Tax=Sphingomonas sp. Leaf412 TaxID=1736370 RepID=UPI000AC2F7E7|nr:hypothetical protein [Sphingomonas sp. Leaf412]
MSDATGHALILATMLILPVSALVARRLPLATTVKYGLIWAAIFTIGAIAVASFT